MKVVTEFESDAVENMLYHAMRNDAPELLQALVVHCNLSYGGPLTGRRSAEMTIAECMLAVGGGRCALWLHKRGYLQAGEQMNAALLALVKSPIMTCLIRVPEPEAIERSAQALIGAGAQSTIEVLANGAKLATFYTAEFLRSLVPTRVDADDIRNFVKHHRGATCFPGADATWLLDLLLERGADPLAIDKDGRTAFHFAVQCNFPDVCTWLLDHGVNPWEKSSPGAPKRAAISSELRGDPKEKEAMSQFLRAAKSKTLLARSLAGVVEAHPAGSRQRRVRL